MIQVITGKKLVTEGNFCLDAYVQCNRLRCRVGGSHIIFFFEFDQHTSEPNSFSNILPTHYQRVSSVAIVTVSFSVLFVSVTAQCMQVKQDF